MLDWLIIGGGIHGTLLSRCLLQEAGVPADRLRVLDPYRDPLHRWRECAGNTGMEFLRSPSAHHLDTGGDSLDVFARTRNGAWRDAFRGAYRRPSRALFEAHAESVIGRCGLDLLRLEGRARAIRSPPAVGLQVDTDRGELRARRAVLATGATDPLWPAWASDLRERGAPIHHLFEPGYRRPELEHGKRALVVGGGLSAVETTLALARRRPGMVTLLSRHEPRVHTFDTDSGWLGPKRMRGFRRESDWARRRQLIAAARHHGSMPADAAEELEAAAREGRARCRRGSIRSATWGDVLELEILDEGHDRCLGADLVLLATGFSLGCPSASWLDGLAETYGPRRAACGYPIVDATLQWYPGVHVCGPLAELELGPTARNIHGARLAARRLVRLASR